MSEILFEEDGAVNISELLFPKHNNKGKGHAMMVSYIERDVEGDVAIHPEGELDLDWIAQQVQSLPNS